MDECYSEIYSDRPPAGGLQAAVALGGALDNLIVCHSLSKRSSAAGLRSGFVAGDPDLIKQRAQRLAQQAVPPLLAAAIRKERAEDPRAELEAILREHYLLQERNHRAIKLIDRCTDHPELGGIWQVAGREGSRAALVRYIASRVEAGQFRAVPSVL